MAAQEYDSFEALLNAGVREGVHFRRLVSDNGSEVTIAAPHGGNIEPRTCDIARAIAGRDFNLYCFLGLRAKEPHKTLHITSHRFDDPQCIALLRNTNKVVTVHGLYGSSERVDVGGRDAALRDAIVGRLTSLGFHARAYSTGPHGGVDPQNICNRGASKRGVQLEITRGLRDKLNGERLDLFASAIRAALTDSEHA